MVVTTGSNHRVGKNISYKSRFSCKSAKENLH